MKAIHLAATILFIATLSCPAQDANSEIVVTATRSPRERLSIPASVSLVDRETIQAIPARNVDDVLRVTPGISLLQSVGMGFGLPSQVNMRGIPGLNSTLMLLDGMPLNEAGTGFMNINEVPVELIDRIEVVRGPFSALYGANAFSGVINILTRAPEDVATVEPHVAIGNDGFFHGGIQSGGGDNTEGYVLSIDWRTIDNYLAQGQIIDSVWNPRTQQYIQRVHPTRNYDYEDQRALLKITKAVGTDTHLTLHGRYSDSELGYGKTDAQGLYPLRVDTTMENQTMLLGGVLDSRCAPTVGSTWKAYYREQTRTTFGLDFDTFLGPIPLYTPSTSETDHRDWKVDGMVDITLAPGHVLTVGGDFWRTDADFSAIRDLTTGQTLPTSQGIRTHIYNVGAYVQDELAVNHAVDLTAAIRLDSHSTFNDEISPKLGIRYRASDTTACYLSAGRAYRAPTTLELHQPDIQFGPIVFASNPNLTPETILSADLGIEQQLSADATLNLSVFYNDMEDLIAKQFNRRRLIYQNVDEAWSTGIEAAFNCHVSDTISAFANGTWQESENERTGKALEHIPELMANAGIRCNHDFDNLHLTVAIFEIFQGERGYTDTANGRFQGLDAYWRTDASARLAYGTTWIGANIQNAFDETYQDWPLINPAPGRLFSLELGAAW